MPHVPRRPLIMYLTVIEDSMAYMLGQHDESGRKEHAIYYLSKKFIDYEKRYSLLKKTCCALAWAGKGRQTYETIYVDPHNSADIQNGSYQIYI